MAHPSWGPPCSGVRKTVERSDGVKLPVRVEIALLVAMLCDETERLMYNLVPGWCWAYACRKIRNSSSWSNHAWALAVDLNAPENPMGPRSGKIRLHPKVIALWKQYGFTWGGDWSSRADDMHFEFRGSKEDAAQLTALLRAKLQGGVATPPRTVITAPAGRPFPGDSKWYYGKDGRQNTNAFDGNVQHIQARLNLVVGSYPAILTDGFFGDQTDSKVREFQKRMGLQIDGKVGPATWGKLTQL